MIYKKNFAPEQQETSEPTEADQEVVIKEKPYCSSCGGSGEGRGPGAACSSCDGLGHQKRKKDLEYE